MMCKYNYVIICNVNYVAINFSKFEIVIKYLVISIYTRIFFIKSLDIIIMYDINKLTLKCEDKYHGKTQQYKIRVVAKTGVLKSSSREGKKRAIPKKRLFRPPGSYPGKIRNASPGTGRKTADSTHRPPIWFFPTIILSGSGKFQTKRTARSNPHQAGPSQRTQIERTCNKIYQKAKNPGWLDYFRHAGQTDRREVRYSNTHTQYSTGSCTKEKKIAIRMEPRVILNSDALCDHYEQLRSYTLKTTDIPVHLYGLGVMLQKGMQTWIEATSEHFQASSFHDNIDSNESLKTLSPMQTQLAGIMADIIIKRRFFNHGSNFKDNRQPS